MLCERNLSSIKSSYKDGEDTCYLYDSSVFESALSRRQSSFVRLRLLPERKPSPSFTKSLKTLQF
ncbi:hypothetical protein ACTXT7_011971 [Hymenolepis weldensis]